jgi:hypothetical protein
LAESFAGTPYLWGGTDPRSGIDCSGLVQAVYGQLGIKLPRTTYEQVNSGTAVSDISQAQPGDLIFLHPSVGGPGHVGIYVGNGQMIDANHTGGSVGVRSLQGYGGIVAIRRVAPGGGGAGGAMPTGGMAGGAGPDPRSSMSYQLGNFMSIVGGGAVSPLTGSPASPVSSPQSSPLTASPSVPGDVNPSTPGAATPPATQKPVP